MLFTHNPNHYLMKKAAILIALIQFRLMLLIQGESKWVTIH